MSKIESEAWEHGTDWQWPVGRGEGNSGKKQKGLRQRTCMNDPWTWTIVWGLTVGMGGRGLGERQQREKNWDNCNRVTIKNYFKKEKKRDPGL